MASLIYTGIVMLAVFAIFTAVFSIFDHRSDFEDDTRSFARWVRTGMENPYVFSVDSDEGFVLGYVESCEERFSDIGTACLPGELCFCLGRTRSQRGDSVEVSRSSCSAVNLELTVEGVNQNDGDNARCVSSFQRRFILRDGHVPGVYEFSFDREEQSITATCRSC